jgi:hypothetical protein
MPVLDLAGRGGRRGGYGGLGDALALRASGAVLLPPLHLPTVHRSSMSGLRRSQGHARAAAWRPGLRLATQSIVGGFPSPGRMVGRGHGRRAPDRSPDSPPAPATMGLGRRRGSGPRLRSAPQPLSRSGPVVPPTPSRRAIRAGSRGAARRRGRCAGPAGAGPRPSSRSGSTTPPRPPAGPSRPRPTRCVCCSADRSGRDRP